MTDEEKLGLVKEDKKPSKSEIKRINVQKGHPPGKKKKKVSKGKKKAKPKKAFKRPVKKKKVKRILVHKSLVRPEKEKENINFKVSLDEAKEIREIAKRYTRGNVTALARLAIKAFKPKKSDLVSIRPSTIKR